MTDNGEAVPSRRLLTRSTSYIPYGEVFVEESSAGWHSPFYFNSKELDEETGLYYYGARYLNPTEARWMSVDPMFEKYVGMSPYNYCAGNPVKYVDEDGREKIIALNERRDKNLIRAANSYQENNNVVHLWAHGVENTEGKNWAIEIESEYIKAKHVDDFCSFLTDKSSVYRQNNEDGRTSQTTLLVMHSCKTGQTQGFAHEVSKKLNLLIVAPSDNLIVSTEINNDGTVRNSKETKVANKGTWNIFYKGDLMDSFNGETKPIFRNPQKVIEKYEKIWQERHNSKYEGK